MPVPVTGCPCRSQDARAGHRMPVPVTGCPCRPGRPPGIFSEGQAGGGSGRVTGKPEVSRRQNGDRLKTSKSAGFKTSKSGGFKTSKRRSFQDAKKTEKIFDGGGGRVVKIQQQ